MKNEINNELEWLAFRYVANELDSTQRNEFEESLAVDQSARDAVERAVLLGQLVVGSQPESSERPLAIPESLERERQVVQKQTDFISPPWVLGAASIGLALLAGGWFWYANSNQNHDRLVVSRVDSQADIDSLVLAWAETLDETEPEEVFEIETDNSLFDDLDRETESWMIDAVQVINGESESKPTGNEQ